MGKAEFMETLRKRLAGLPQAEIEERLAFYNEMIDDRIEDGLTEEEAVAEVGPVEDVVNQIMSEIPLTALVREKVRPKRTLRVWEIILLVLGSPIWLSLLIAVFIAEHMKNRYGSLMRSVIFIPVIVSLWVSPHCSGASPGFRPLACSRVPIPPSRKNGPVFSNSLRFIPVLSLSFR